MSPSSPTLLDLHLREKKKKRKKPNLLFLIFLYIACPRRVASGFASVRSASS